MEKKSKQIDKPSTIKAVRQLFTEYLTAQKCRKTPERYAILETIYTIDGHFDIETLYRLLEERQFRVSRATIYNTILLLLKCHLVQKHQIGNSAQFEKAYKTQLHHHLICMVCGKVTERTDEDIHKVISETKFPRFHQSQYALYVYGVCASCQRKKRNSRYK